MLCQLVKLYEIRIGPYKDNLEFFGVIDVGCAKEPTMWVSMDGVWDTSANNHKQGRTGAYKGKQPQTGSNNIIVNEKLANTVKFSKFYFAIRFFHVYARWHFSPVHTYLRSATIF